MLRNRRCFNRHPLNVLILLLCSIPLLRDDVHSQLSRRQPGFNSSKLITQYTHDVWETEDGLPQNSITSILQSRDGYLWLGTLEGLVRFDGVHFTTFDRRNTPAIKSKRILAIKEDHTGGLWIGTEGGGLTRLTNGGFTSFTTANGLASNTVLSILVDHEGNVLIGTEGAGLFKFDAGEFHSLPGNGFRVSKNSGAQFTHGLCPDCVRKLYPEYPNETEQ